ncbi:hypothetical protein [Sulfurimonas sp.]
MKTDMLQVYGIQKSEVIFVQTTKGTKISLCVRNLLSSDDEIIFKVLGKYFEDFLVSQADKWFEELQNKAIMAGFRNAGDVTDMAKDVIAMAFETYLQDNDFEIICDIEQEKSPFYANQFSDFKLQKIAS